MARRQAENQSPRLSSRGRCQVADAGPRSGLLYCHRFTRDWRRFCRQVDWARAGLVRAGWRRWFIASVIGAVILLGIYRLIIKRRSEIP